MMRKRVGALLLGSVLVLVSAFAVACQKKQVPTLEEPLEHIPTDSERTERTTSTRSTVLYYQDEAGYLVPVLRRIPWEEDIASSALSLLVSNAQNDLDAARLGLYTVIPEGTVVSVTINEDLAEVSLSEQANTCADAAKENNMVHAIVNTLTEWPNIEKVQLQVAGQPDKLAHGTSVAKSFTRRILNVESTGKTSLAGAQRVSLFFGSDSADVMVPVSRAVFSTGDLETAVVELLKGPKKDSGLTSTLPENAALISVTYKDKVVTVNLTKEFKAAMEAADGGAKAIKSLVLTCQQFPGVEKVKLAIEGKVIDAAEETLVMPTCANVDDSDVGMMSMSSVVEVIPD